MAKPSKRGGRVSPAVTSRTRARASASRARPPAVAPVVAVMGTGASAGGLEGLQKLFQHMPPDAGIAFVVQHHDPRRATLLPELLGRTTSMSVEQVEDETPVEADHVYVIPPNTTLTIEQGVLRVRSPAESQGVGTSNEELLSTNEELQSANEELETINSELTKKVEQLDGVDSDAQNLLQSTRIPTLFLDRDLRIQRFTEAATAVFRLTDSDVGRPVTDLAPLFEGDVLADLEEVRRTHAPRERQVRLVDASATYLMRILPHRRADDVVEGEVLTFLDVTELNDALEQHARLASIVESSQDAIVGRSFDGAITTWNAGAAAMFGYSEAEAIGSPISLIVPPDQMELVEEVHARLRRGEVVLPFESVRVARDGRRLDVSAAVSLLKDAGGRVVGASMILRDITELKRTQQALRRELNARDRFLALLSHELRNPLAPLRTSLELLKERRSDPVQSERSLSVMDRQLAHLTSLVDQLLDAARISSGKIVLEQEDLDLVELVRAVVEDHGKTLADAGLEVKLSLPGRPLFVSADRVRISQALGNLLGNAGKFTPRGGQVEVSARAESDERSATVTVSDSGVGVEPGMLDQLFRPFTQAANPAGRGRGGLGLGLALVRAFVESHGGTVEARSGGPDQGARFSIRLPLLAEGDRPRADASAERSRRGASAIPRRILVVEDNPDASESLRLLLTLSGHEVETAGDGSAALEKARGFRPDVVLCDLGLPGALDGFAVAEEIRADPALGSPHLVALTGFGQADDREQARAAGFDRHLTKPADPDVLRRLLDELPERG
jgi:two-component system, chemotaxis family, CheB/CheR fusion protein